MSEQAYNCPVCTAALTAADERCDRCGMPQAAYRDLLSLPERHFARGMRLMQRGSYDEALEHINTARRLQPDRPEGLRRAVTCLMNLGRYEYALQTLMAVENPDAEINAMRAECVKAIDRAHYGVSAGFTPGAAASNSSASSVGAENVGVSSVGVGVAHERAATAAQSNAGAAHGASVSRAAASPKAASLEASPVSGSPAPSVITPDTSVVTAASARKRKRETRGRRKGK